MKLTQSINSTFYIFIWLINIICFCRGPRHRGKRITKQWILKWNQPSSKNNWQLQMTSTYPTYSLIRFHLRVWVQAAAIQSSLTNRKDQPRIRHLSRVLVQLIIASWSQSWEWNQRTRTFHSRMNKARSNFLDTIRRVSNWNRYRVNRISSRIIISLPVTRHHMTRHHNF